MPTSNRLRCLVCGHHHEGPHDRHHCTNCFADRYYLRPASAASVSAPASAASPRA